MSNRQSKPLLISRAMRSNRLPISVLTAVLLLVAGSAMLIPRLQFDYDFEQFFPHNDPDLDYYHQFRERFEPDDNYILVALENGEGLFEPGFLQQVKRFTEDCADLPHITQSISLTNYSFIKAAAGYPYKSPAIHLEDPSRYAVDSARIMSDKRIVNGLISEDGKALTVALKTEGVLDLPQSQRLHDALDSLITVFGFPQVYVAGRSHYQALFVENEKREFTFYTVAAALLIFVIVTILFRRGWGVLIAVLSVMFGMTLFLGLLSLLKIRLDPMSTLFPILMVIVGMSDVVHIMSKYLTELRSGIDKRTAMKRTIREVGLATFLTSVTTAVGFLSLYTSSVPPIKTFGLLAALGVFIAFLTVITFTTAALVLFEDKHLARARRKNDFWRTLMTKAYNFTARRTNAVGLAAIALVGICIIGISQVTTNVSIDKQFPRDQKVYTDFKFFETRFGGMRPFEIGAAAQNGLTMDSLSVLAEIGKLENYLTQSTALVAVTTPASIYKDLNRAFNGDRVGAHRVPESARRLGYYRTLVSRAPGEIMKTVVSKDKLHGRISARFPDIGTTRTDSLKEEITAWVSANTDPELVQFKQTGSTHLFDKNNEYVRRSIFFGLGLAFLVVSIIMGLLFRNFRMVLISLVPNIFPILICGAIIGYLGIELSAATAIIFAISFGIAVDDTIHFLARFRIERGKGLGVSEAMRNTFLETGKAICLTTVILFAGFIILVSSSYPNTITIGVMMSLTLVSAVFADLLLAPVLIYWLIGRK